MLEKVALIIPCFNEASRIDLGSFRAVADQYRFVFVSDGSTDGTAEFIRNGMAGTDAVVLDLPRNVGKAEAVRAGVLHALSEPKLGDRSWIGFWDADLSTPLHEVSQFIRYSALVEEVDAVFGSRIYKLGSRIERKFMRWFFGRLFATAIKIVLDVGSYDSQCGAKLFRREAALRAFAEPFVSRWIFDVEIILRLGETRLLECPVRAWADVPGSKLKVSREAFRVLADIRRLRDQYLARRPG